jgi:hypothetical protein
MPDDDSFRQSYTEGLNLYNNARRRAFWQEVIGLLRGKPAELLSFDDIKTRLRLREESYKGLQDVPLDRIVGSVGRYRDFTSSFLPRKSTSAERWSRVYASVNSLEGVPPVELYKVDDVYFVRDGNHRVSVARQIGARTIQAHVTELPTSVNLEPGMTQEELDAAVEYALFLEETGLKRSRPHHQSMQLSEPSRYCDLRGHIHVHQTWMEHTLGHPVSFEEAAADWYDSVYRPAITLIRKYGVIEENGSRTEADLYLWMVDHLTELRAAWGDEAPSRKFSHALVEYLRQQHIAVPPELCEEDDRSVALTRTQVMRAVEIARARERDSADSPHVNGNGSANPGDG